MRKLKNKFLAFTTLIVTLFYTSNAMAICPLCTIAVGAGVGLSRWLKIDDSVTGIWIGALTVSLIVWTIDYLNRKNIRFYGRKILVVLTYYAFIALPLYWSDILWHPLNTLWGIDKLMLGIGIGTVAFSASVITYNQMKKRHGGRAYFKGQKVVMPLAVLIILSLIFYFITKVY